MSDMKMTSLDDFMKNILDDTELSTGADPVLDPKPDPVDPDPKPDPVDPDPKPDIIDISKITGVDPDPVDPDPVDPVDPDPVDPVDPDPKPDPVSDIYKATLRSMMEKGHIAGIESFETEDGEISFDEMEIDEELFTMLIGDSIEERASGSVQLNDLSDLTQSLINIEEAGGDTLTILKNYKAAKSPLEKLDLELPKDQIAALQMFYGAKGLDSKTMERVIKSSIDADTLEADSEEAYEVLAGAYNQYIVDEEKKAVEKQVATKEREKNLKKDLKVIFKDNKLGANFSKALTSKISISDQGVNFGDLLQENTETPEQIADLLMFLSDKEGYIKRQHESTVNRSNVKLVKGVKNIKRRTTTPVIRKNEDEDIIDISTILGKTS